MPEPLRAQRRPVLRRIVDAAGGARYEQKGFAMAGDEWVEEALKRMASVDD